tara:strand:- start:35 stop:388 length:354 start_codon:yes stop_codon:yes gene_type:complete
MAGPGLYANIHAKRKRGGKMRKKGAKGAPKASDFARAKQTARKGMKKGGFPDLSGDGKVTKKDILMGRGVIPRAKKTFGGRAVKQMGKVLKQMKNRNVKNITKKPKPKQMKRGGRAK